MIKTSTADRAVKLPLPTTTITKRWTNFLDLGRVEDGNAPQQDGNTF